MTTLYLVRHAQSEGNNLGRMQGQTDMPLSALGRAQLEPLAERCRDMQAGHLYTSPLKRAKETALAVNRYLNLPMTDVDALMEISVGVWENQLMADIEAGWPEERRVWNEQHHLFVSPGGGETMRQVYDRVVAALLDIAARHPDEAVFIVSHGCAIRNMCAWALGGPEHASSQDWVGNTSLSRIDVDAQGRPTLVFRSDIGHLGELESPKDRA